MLKQFLEMNPNIVKGSMSVIAEPLANQEDDSDPTFDLELAAGVEGAGYWGEELEELEEVWIFLHGLSETSRNMEHLAEKCLKMDTMGKRCTQ